jgi:hypothetical protein
MAEYQIKLPPTSKIGETPEGRSKFDSWHGNSGYYKRPETYLDPYKTDKMMCVGPTDEEAITNATLCATMRASNKSKVDVKRTNGTVAQEFTKSQNMENYIDQRSWSKKLLDYDYDSFRDSFFLFLEEDAKTNLASSDDFSISVWTKNVPKIVKHCLGNDVPEFIIDRFAVLSRKYNNEGRISWVVFREDVVPKVMAAVHSECQFRRELPALLQLMNRPRLVDKDIGALGDISTNYRDFFNKSSDISFSESSNFTFKKGVDAADATPVVLNEASRVLCAGTIKGTLQTPGYKGHVPRNVSNLKKREHSNGQITHPVSNNLRLTQRGMGAVLGYTGHIPHVIEGGNRERCTGTDPRTSTGAAYGVVRAYL